MKKINNEENNYVEKGRKSFKIVKTEVLKSRIPKAYRIAEIDSKIRKSIWRV